LADLRKGRLEMEHFVQEFSTTVTRAEAGIKGLKHAARESGDDLEKLIDRAGSLRDELHFIVESADQTAARLSTAAATAAAATAAVAAARPAPRPAEKTLKPEIVSASAPAATPRAEAAPEPAAAPGKKQGKASRAEAELMQALEKLG
jgi:hypothetical protein